MPAADSLRLGGLPIGLAHNVRLRSPIKAGSPVRWADVTIDAASESVRIRREMEEMFRREPATAQRPAAE